VIPLSGTEAYGLTATADAVWAVLYQSEVLSRVDPETNEEVAAIDAGPGAASLLTVGNDVWLARYGGAGSSDPDVTIYRDGEAVSDLEAGELCCDLTLLGDAVWGIDPAGSLVGMKRVGGAVVGRIRVPRLHFDIHTNVVAGGDSLWVSSDDTPLFRVDPGTGMIADTVKTGGGVPFVEVDGLLWGAKPDELWAVDVEAAKVIRRIQLADSVEVISMAIDEGAIWLGMRHVGVVGAVERLDPKTGEVLADIPVDVPARIVPAFGSVWVTDSGSGSLYRLDPDATSGV
jgi:sugar lactone lactonase YvrE